MKKIIRVFEIMFLVMMTLSIIEATRLFILGNYKWGAIFVVFAGVALLMNRVRRKQRLALEEQERKQNG